MEKIKSFYNNKKVFVTGVTGFKGSWLCSWLLKLGAKVYGTGFNPNQNKNLFSYQDVTEIILHFSQRGNQYIL